MAEEYVNIKTDNFEKTVLALNNFTAGIQSISEYDNFSSSGYTSIKNLIGSIINPKDYANNGGMKNINYELYKKLSKTTDNYLDSCTTQSICRKFTDIFTLDEDCSNSTQYIILNSNGKTRLNNMVNSSSSGKEYIIFQIHSKNIENSKKINWSNNITKGINILPNYDYDFLNYSQYANYLTNQNPYNVQYYIYSTEDNSSKQFSYNNNNYYLISAVKLIPNLNLKQIYSNNNSTVMSAIFNDLNINNGEYGYYKGYLSKAYKFSSQRDSYMENDNCYFLFQYKQSCLTYCGVHYDFERAPEFTLVEE